MNEPWHQIIICLFMSIFHGPKIHEKLQTTLLHTDLESSVVRG